MKLRKLLVVAALVSVAVVQAHAEDGNAGNGYKLALDSCSSCHNIEKGAPFKLYPPSFQSIAIFRDRLDIWGRIVAPSPHRGMPAAAWTLGPDDVQDLVAYITSLDRAVTIPE